MNSPSNLRWGAILLFGGVAVVLFLIDLTGNSLSLVRLLTDPMATVSGWVSQPTATITDNLNQPSSIVAAVSEINELQAEVERLERENEELRNLEGEYNLLLSLFDYAADSPENQRIAAGVIARNPSPLFQSIIIDKGTNDGVQVGMPVDSERGLVGQVFRTTPDSAMILLITDRSSGIPGRLSESRTAGVIHGNGESNNLSLDWIPLEAEIEVGDVVITSGLVGVFQEGLLVGRFPKGLIIGRVADIERNEAEILQNASIQTDVNFNELELVFVITDFPKEDITPFEDPLGEQ